jgi:Tol biopolymer transport system component
MIDWWPWWISSAVALSIAVASVLAIARRPPRSLARALGVVAFAGVAAAVAAPLLMGGDGGVAAMAGASTDGAKGKIAFVRDGAIYVVDAAGGRVQRLGGGSILEPANDPDWSPDGTRIAYSRHCRLYLMPAAGGRSRPLATLPEVCANEPVWSPDGAKIAFIQRASGGARQVGVVYAIGPDGTGLRPLSQSKISEDGFDDRFPEWSPDGKRIVFARGKNGPSPDPRLYVMNGDGTGIEPLGSPDPRTASENMPVWSSDGRWIAFGRMGPVGTRLDMMSVYAVEADGDGRKRVSRTAANEMTDGDFYPVWSPDASMIAFAGAGIGVMTADGTGRRMLTHRYGDTAPDWSPR